MTLLQTTAAQTLAGQNLDANLSALDQTQPELRPWVAEMHLPVEWVLARDQALTGLESDGQWFAGCSLPKRAAEKMLAKLQIKGMVTCFLTPGHAAHLSMSLQKLRPEQAVIAIVPDTRDLAMLLHCEDLSEAISSHRLWFAAGAAWEVGLQRIFDAQPGLAVPSQFIRTPDADAEQTDALIASAQKVFARTNTNRSTEMQALLRSQASSAPRGRICVVAPTRFRLWNDIGYTMLQAMKAEPGIEVVPFDADDPLCGSPLALVKAARQCGALLTANTSRTDLPGVIPETTPWITWLTTARIPASTLAGAEDHLILVDPNLRDAAIAAGWNASRIHVGTWPGISSATSANVSKHLALIADTRNLETPKDLTDYSSHSLLWEAIRFELAKNPLAIDDPMKYLRERMRRAQIGVEGFQHARFIDELILPAYQQGLARILIAAKLPLQLWGRGWTELPEFGELAAGPIDSREKFNQAISSATAVIHGWPGAAAHPIESLAKTLVRRSSNQPAEFVRIAREALARPRQAQTATTAAQTFSAELIGSILKSQS